MSLLQKTQVRIAPRPLLQKPVAAAPVAAPEEDLIEEVEEQADDQAEDQVDEQGEDQAEEAAAPAPAPVIKRMVAKPAAIAPAVKPAAKPAAAAPAVAKVAKPKAAPAEAAEGEVAPVVKKVKKAVSEAVSALAAQAEGLASGIQLPALGARIAKEEQIAEMYLGYWEARKEALDEIRAKDGDQAYALAMFRLPFTFLLGDLKGEITDPAVEAIVQNGGLAHHWNVAVMGGVYLKSSPADRVYPNPRANRADPTSPTSMKVDGRRIVEMRVQVTDGITTPGFTNPETGEFTAA